MAIVLVHKDIVCTVKLVNDEQSMQGSLTPLVFARRKSWWRECEALHLRRLRKQRPSTRFASHIQ